MKCSPDVLSSQCPSRLALDLVADKWTTLIIYTLMDQTLRYGEIQRQVGGISQKMLTQTLRGLERDGLVQRKVYPEVPPHTEYTLTPLGATLIKPLKGLCEWAMTHLPELEKARRRYDAQAEKAQRSA